MAAPRMELVTDLVTLLLTPLTTPVTALLTDTVPPAIVPPEMVTPAPAITHHLLLLHPDLLDLTHIVVLGVRQGRVLGSNLTK